MDFVELGEDLSFENINLADNMAASEAPTTTTTTLANTTNVSSTSTSLTTITATTTDNIEHNFHELCRSCGKTNAELYDLFQATNSPFSTSSTTCYTHLNNCNSTSCSTTSSIATLSSTLAPPNKPSPSTTFTAAGCSTKSSLTTTTAFDSVAATAKATAKGQSNMDNILQEMQIWQLLIKCNDGLPQRICAKCTAQFYMIHKFRRKCLKVQTQLRALYEEQQQQQEQQKKFYERQHEQQQEEQKENNVTVKEVKTTIEATSTPTAEAEAVASCLEEEIVKPPAVMHKVNDLVSDNYGPEEEQEKAKEEAAEKAANVDNTNTKSSSSSSVSFEANTGNTNDFIAPTTTLLDNVETMPQKTEANEPTPTSSPALTNNNDNNKTFEARPPELECSATTALFKRKKDEKKPLLKPSILDANRSPPLTLQQPLKQVCDNETLTAAGEQQTNASKKFCLDQEDFLDTHIIFKNKPKQTVKPQYLKNSKNSDEEELSSSSLNSSPCLSNEEKVDKVIPENKTKTVADCKLSTENLFITKAALKAYTVPPSTAAAGTSEHNENRDHQKPITNSEAIELNNNNDNNNNAPINTIYTSNRYDNRRRIQLNNNSSGSSSSSNSSSLNSTPPTSSCNSSSSVTSTPSSCNSRLSRKRKRLNNAKTKVIKYASLNKRPGHCYKTTKKALTETKTVALTKKARTLQSYSHDCLKMVVKKRKKQNKHKLKRLLQKTKTTTVSTSLNATTTTTTRRGRKKHQHLQNFKICHKKSIQIEDEMSATIVSTTTATPTKTKQSCVTSTSPCSSSAASSCSTAISSTSLCYLRATTPANAATTTTDLVRNRNITKKGSSSADRLSSGLKTCTTMWKTKAAMKANANDMPVNEENDDDDQPTGNTAQITLPYIANAATTTSSSSSTSLISTCSSFATKSLTETPQQSSKIPNDENQNINNNNNNLSQNSGNHNKVTIVTSAGGKQEKDINYEIKNIYNLKTEEVDHQQFKTTQQQTENAAATQEIATIEHEHKTPGIELNNLNPVKVKENPHKEQNIKQEDQQQKPVKKGSMKLIIQRKRGKRFKCRPKSEDELVMEGQQIKQEKEEESCCLTGKRKRKKPFASSSSSASRSQNLKCKLEQISFVALDSISNTKKDDETTNLKEPQSPADNNKVPEFNSNEDENKENPIPLTNNYDFDSDSNVSLYRDPLLIRNEALEEDTPVTDFTKIQLSIQNECSKEMYKLYKEKANLESPKKLIVRVPLTSLTQDFKRLHLTKDEQENDEDLKENENESQALLKDPNQTEYEIKEILSIKETNETPPKELAHQCINSEQEEQETSQLNTSGSQSDFLGFSQTTENSSVASAEIMRYIEPPLCSASSKINDFINDFQNNCIDSSEIEETCDIVPTLGPQITQELSDEIRDVEDTLNGIISEMHDKDMYTPRSGETDEFFNHSVYSPLTDAPTTPSQSFYAESPCTINSNPMSVSPFIHHNMDYNAMTPQSNHSGMGFASSSSSYMGGGGSTGSHTGVYSEHYPTYNESFEETTQSELITFQNDIPCFEKIELGMGNNPAEIALENNVEENETENDIKNEQSSEIEQFPPTQATENPEDDTLTEDMPITNENIQAHQQQQQIPYTNTTYQTLNQTPTFHMQTAINPLVSRPNTQPHYIVTNANQGSIIITNPAQITSQAREQIVPPAFKPHSNNLQFVTLGQAMKAAQPNATNPLLNNNTGHHWPTAVTNTTNFNQRPLLTTNHGTTTYFINANGELYQANIPSNNLATPTNVNTIFVPPNSNPAFNKTRIDNTNNYVQAIHRQPPQPPQTHPTNQNPSSQYIMLVNNLNGSPQYYATTPSTNLNQTVSPAPQNITGTPTVLIQPAPQTQTQTQTNTNNYLQKHPANDQRPEPTSHTPTNTPPTISKTHHVPITPALEPRADMTMHQQINQQLQKQIKQRQYHHLQPRSPNVPQKINLVCRFCHKRPKFTNNVDYSNHIINTHPAEKPYNCPHCPTHFSRRSDRQMHVAQAHGARFQCAQCGLSFSAQRTLDFHLQKYHAHMGRSQQQQHLLEQQNSSSKTAPATYQLLQHNQQQRLVRVEDVHLQVTDENKAKRSIELPFNKTGGEGGIVDIKASSSQPLNEVEMLSDTTGAQQQQQQQKSRKLCCPDCNGDNDDCCGDGSEQNPDHNDINSNCAVTQQTAANSNLQNTGNESVNNTVPQQHSQHVTIPSPEQTEPDSTTTLRHFRKRQLCEISTSFTSACPTSSSSSSFSHHNISGNNNGGIDNNNINLNHNSPDNFLAGVEGGEQIVVERTLRGSHNCLLCEESFTNEIALRKHHHLAHGAGTQSSMSCSIATTATSSTSSSFLCTICKRSFRMRNALQRHMETHDAEGRPYECNICQVRFPRPSQLTLHKLTVHKFEKPISCEECGKQFGTESAMKAHAIEHEEAARATVAKTAEPSTSSASTFSSQSQLSSSTNNEQNMNLQSTTSNEDVSAAVLNNNDNNLDDDAFNNPAENVIVSEIVT